MTQTLYLAWRYVGTHRLKSAVLVMCVALSMYLPLAAHWLMVRFEREWYSRADATPLLIGTRGSRFDLTLQSLYFTGSPLDSLPLSEVHRVRDSAMALAIPLRFGHTARQHPIVGTSIDYFDYRGLVAVEGELPMVLGDCVLGAEVARGLGLRPGGRLLSDPDNVFDIAGAYPLNMLVVGVLGRTGTPDDRAVFVDVKSTWVIEGIGHGHQDMAAAEDAVVLRREGNRIVANAALPQFTTITPENLHTFHFHAEEEALPISAIIAVPHDQKSAALLRGRYLGSEERAQIIPPVEVIGEMMSMVLRVRRLFDASTAVVTITTLLFLFLVMVLSFRLRRREMEIMVHLGCSRLTILMLHAMELLIVLAASLVVAALMAWLTATQADRLMTFLFLRGG